MTISTGEVSFTGGTESGSGGADGCKVTLEQKPWKKLSVTFADMQLLIDMVLSGLSAHNLLDTDCPVELKEAQGDAEIFLEFYILKSREDIEVTLEANGGVLVIEPTESVIDREESVIFGLESSIQFDYRITEVSAEWESKVIDTSGNVLTTKPDILIHSTSISVPVPIFGVARLSMKVLVTRCFLRITVPKSKGYKVSNVAAVVTARWMCGDEERSTALTFTIPPCVYDQLSTCPDGTLKNAGAMKMQSPNYTDNSEITQIYFNSCTGDVMGTVKLRPSIGSPKKH